MTKEQTIAAIQDLLAAPDFRDDWEMHQDAADIFDRIPIVLCENGGDLTFTEAVRFAGHDLFRECAT